MSLPPVALGALAVGWATVELDRAASELSHLLVPGSAFEEAPPSVLLGARCRVGSTATRSGLRIVLLEPDTEGRLAATLARSGEIWAATWALTWAVTPSARAAPAAPAAGTAPLSAVRPGPLGGERLLLGGPPFGPYRLQLDAVPSPP